MFCLCTVKKDFILSALIIADNSTACSKDNVILSCTRVQFLSIQDNHWKTADVSQCHHDNAEIPHWRCVTSQCFWLAKICFIQWEALCRSGRRCVISMESLCLFLRHHFCRVLTSWHVTCFLPLIQDSSNLNFYFWKATKFTGVLFGGLRRVPAYKHLKSICKYLWLCRAETLSNFEAHYLFLGAYFTVLIYV